MIVRDEERFLPACLESVHGAVDEVVVVDTGSRDATPEIAARYGARVLGFPWSDDFAAARNRALEAARGEWMLVLDADERLAPGAGPALRAVVAEPGWDAGYLRFANVGEDGACGREWTAPRLYRLYPGVRYIGRIHEQVVHPRLPVRTRILPVQVYHYGYQAGVYAEKQKRERNTRLLERALADPEAADPILRSNYLFHYANLATGAELVGRYERLAAFVRDRWGEEPPRLPWITGALAEYARILTDIGRYEEAGRLAARLLERHGESPTLRYLLARSRAAAGDAAGAEAELAKVLAPAAALSEEHAQYTQDLPLVMSRARFLLGLIRERQGRLEEAVELYRASTEEEPEQDMLRSHYACALVRLGRYPEALAALERSASLVNRPQPGADCLGLVLAVVTRSVARLALWGDKVRRLAPQYPHAARLLERLAELDPRRPIALEDFPEVVAALELEVEPGRVRMPQTGRGA